jgi:peptide/nickel transport system permease protein
MLSYIIRRLLLLPITLFCIVIVNFVIINLAPGDPTTVTDVSASGDVTKQEDQSVATTSDDQYLQFREHYGLTLPVLFNTWSFLSQEYAATTLERLTTYDPTASEMDVKEYNTLRITFGDQSRYIMGDLLGYAINEDNPWQQRQLAIHYFIRGGTRQGFVGANVTPQQRKDNNKIAHDNQLLREHALDDESLAAKNLATLTSWYSDNAAIQRYEPSSLQQAYIIFFETRLCKYLSRVVTLDFGTLRNDSNKKVIDEVSKRFKYSLTLAFLPMIITFMLCQIFGCYMAVKQNTVHDLALNIVFLTLYALPIFVVAPFLIEKVALNNTFPFTDIPIPFSGFTSKESIYLAKTSWQRLWDMLQHIALPLVAIMYGSLAAQTRLSRTAILEVLRQDYVRTARAKGLSTFTIMWKHVGRNASITIVTSIAGSLGVILGGSLIIETIFEINGFGRFFYEAIINRDYNVIMFSALSGSFLALTGYLFADVAYTLLDPRITLD